MAHANGRKPRLLLLDGHSLAYRAFFVVYPPNRPDTGLAQLSITNERGEKEFTGVVYTFANMLLRVWNEQQPDYIAAAFDVGATFRDAIYPEYKSTRQKSPETLEEQVTRIQHLLKTFDIPIFTAEGFEADDVLGTLARRAAGEGMEVMIVTGDRDALQLVSPAVKVLTSRQRFEDTILYDEALVESTYGVRPDQLIDYKALVGDASDNIPGVRGIGEKTAQALLQQYGTLDGIYAHLDAIAPKRVRGALEAGRDAAYLSRQLAAIRTDLPLDVNWDACAAQFDYQRVLSLFRELRFESLIKRIPQAPAAAEVADAGDDAAPAQLSMFDASAEQPPTHFVPRTPTRARLVDSDGAYKALLAALNDARRIAFDTETTDADPLRGELIGLSFCVREGEGWYLPCVAHTASVDGDKAPPWHLDPTSPKFEPVVLALQRREVELIAHNAKFDLEVLRGVGVTLDKPVFDTMIAQFLCDPGGRALGLKQMAFNYFGWQMTEIGELIGRGKRQITMREVPIEHVAAYAAADADATYRLRDVLEPMLRERNQERLFYEVEGPLIPVLVDMEMAGVALDVKYLGELSGEITERLRDLEKRIYNVAGIVFNINSTKQLSDVLFGKLGLPTQGLRKTEAGGFSTAADVLDGLRDQHEIVPLILEHRELSKLQGTYVNALPKLINPKTGRLHTDFNQTGAVTGRLSSSNPNLQNIPAKTEMGRRVRKAFIPRKGWRLISADYSQVELRILAHLADDPTLKEAFANNEDIHATTAAAIYDVPLRDVTPMQRSNAKRINFGIAYGMGAFALAANTGMTQAEAQEFINRYFARFPRVRDWLEATKRHAAERGYVETVLGRRRYFPELTSRTSPEPVRRRAEREAINHPVQGSAADIMKIAMINVHRKLREGGYQARMTLQVHDELVFDCPPNELAPLCALIKREMESAYRLSVPLRADIAAGKNWDEVEAVS
ncbi:MAG: DNA polymerase I [Chloroflexi bacterium]|jgi:DNA polymerase-1|uniref:DNA polymerase I n=1 Tax=Candidatus Thermofonsia Clade 3 bacterium TaxID=2364212 RepID=A0A2M8QG37_9CHLR|nr:DNA polymerase I [Candidatus Roseilinea sp. NK_OTU-006]PJF48767.1 MAG: DNA polymerase I [Candidatus Thermofonsia Clade 3 bacterium]RMG63598.1 MAG: DNA polymerase I [Chloroflexota bacterium]